MCERCTNINLNVYTILEVEGLGCFILGLKILCSIYYTDDIGQRIEAKTQKYNQLV